jgi:hypothetical protein
MPLMLGSFSSGLFNGAASAMNLYQAYQGIRTADLAWSNAQDAQNASDVNRVNANVPGWNDYTQQPQAIPASALPAYGAPSSTTGTATGSAEPAPTPATPVKATPASASVPTPSPGTTGGAGDKGQPQTPYDSRSDLSIRQMKAAADALNAASHAGKPEPGEDTKLVTPPPTPPVSTTPVDDLGRPVPAINTAPMPTVTVRPNAVPAPAPFNAAGVSGAPGTPSGPPPGGRPEPGTIAGVMHNVVGGITGALTGPSAGFNQPAPAPYTPPPPSVTQEPGGYAGQGPVGQAVAPTPGMAVRPPPVIPPYQPPATPAPPAAGAPITGGVPVAQAAPPPAPAEQPGLGSRILSALNPIGTAEAAPRPPPTIPPAAQPAPAATPAPAAPAAAEPTGSTKESGITVTGTTPATPAAATKTPPAPAPVTVTGKGAEVAPGQKTPSVQSETTPAALAPHVTPSFYNNLPPEKKAMVDQAIKTFAPDGSVTREQLAAHWTLEGGAGMTAPRGSAGPEYGTYKGLPGEVGPLQFTPATLNAVAGMPGAQAAGDPETAQGGLNLATKYLKYLAVDKGLGVGTVQTDYGYMRGVGGVQRAAADINKEMYKTMPNGRRVPTVAAAEIFKMHPDFNGKIDQALFPGGGQQTTGYTPQGAAVAAASGPDGVLKYLSTQGPVGLGMSDRWQHLQAGLEAYAIATGHLDQLPHVADYVAQIAHQGAVSNLAAAHQAMTNGDMQGAAQFLAKAHAFFPDNSYARFGVDNKNTLWAEQFSEKDGKPLGQPFQITQDAIAQQALVLQNPRNFVQVLQQYRAANAKIDLDKAHAQYFEEKPLTDELKQESMDRRQAEREAAADQRQTERLNAGSNKPPNTTSQTNPIDRQIEKDYDPQNLPKGADPELNGRTASVDRQLRYPPVAGGEGMAGPQAQHTASQIMKGAKNGGWSLQQTQDSDGNTGFRLVDKDGKVHGYLSNDSGTKILGIAGAQRVGGAIPAGGQQHTSVVGAGASSPMVAMQGLNQNLAGQPPQQQAAA